MKTKSIILSVFLTASFMNFAESIVIKYGENNAQYPNTQLFLDNLVNKEKYSIKEIVFSEKTEILTVVSFGKLTANEAFLSKIEANDINSKTLFINFLDKKIAWFSKYQAAKSLLSGSLIIAGTVIYANMLYNRPKELNPTLSEYLSLIAFSKFWHSALNAL